MIYCQNVKNNKVKLWTRQHKNVLKEIEEKGEYIVKKDYIKEKNDTIADYYIKLYDWYTSKADKIVSRPEGVSYPIWLSTSKELSLQPVEGTVILVLEVDIRNVVLTNFEKWGYVVNYWYVPINKEDEIKHKEELKKYNIYDESALIMSSKGNFYPLLKNKIINSWERIFEVNDKNPGMTQATIWQIKKEWIVDILYK